MEREFLSRIDAHMARGNELMGRIDAHMARGNELMGRIDEHMTRGNELMEQVREEMRLSREEARRNREVHEDLRGFIREQTARMQQAAREQSTRLDGLTRAIDDMRDQIRANTEAVLRALDRLPGNGGPAPAAG